MDDTIEYPAEYPAINADEMAGEAWAAMTRQDADEALRLWERVRRQFPERADGHVWPVQLLWQGGRIDDAEAAAAEAFARFPDEPGPARPICLDRDVAAALGRGAAMVGVGAGTLAGPGRRLYLGRPRLVAIGAARRSRGDGGRGGRALSRQYRRAGGIRLGRGRAPRLAGGAAPLAAGLRAEPRAARCGDRHGPGAADGRPVRRGGDGRRARR